jgi:hypothetical protein
VIHLNPARQVRPQRRAFALGLQQLDPHPALHHETAANALARVDEDQAFVRIGEQPVRGALHLDILAGKPYMVETQVQANFHPADNRAASTTRAGRIDRRMMEQPPCTVNRRAAARSMLPWLPFSARSWAIEIDERPDATSARSNQ